MSGEEVFEGEAEWEVDPSGVRAPFPGETRAEACRRWAAEDEIEEDPIRAAQEAHLIRSLKEDEIFAADLSRRSLESLPAAIRRLYKRNPSNPKLRALYDSLTTELYARVDDVMRSSLLDSVEEIVALMDCGDPSVRLRAATYVFERFRGKTPEVLQVTQDKPFQVVLERIAHGPRIAAERLDGSNGGEMPVDAEIVAETPTAPGTAVAHKATGTEVAKVTHSRARQRKTAW